ncbi:uncharacterized protein LOC141852591 isoform X2 [Brevipalpus obovatus]|uniref:uncharacterized protein LOC141852591 isoform X2 n=1 Tax=Brevipalpus obovatus TaxID=246614 RepID=UPI003D9DDD3B
MNLLWSASLFFGLFLIGSANLAQQSKYVITVPKVISPKDSKICLVPVTGRFSIPANDRYVKVSLLEPSSGKTLTEKREQLQDDDVTCVELSLAPLRHYVAKLVVEVPNVLSEEKIVRISPTSIGMSLIETSKPVYKPGDQLKFRVINFDGRMNLYETVLDKVSVYNPFNYKVMEWKNVTINNGMEIFKHPLAYQNVEGIWKITVLTFDNQLIEKNFEVSGKEPEVYVDLKSDPYIYANHQNQRVVLCAKDKQGNPIFGQFRVVAYHSNPQEHESLGGQTEENGCIHLTLHDSKLEWSKRVGAVYTLQVTFNTENPNHLLTVNKLFPVVRSPIFLRKLSNKFVHNYFKPGLPYFGYLVASKPNSDPVVGQEVRICYQIRSQPWIAHESQLHCSTIRSEQYGAVKFVIPPVDRDAKQIYIEANFPGITDHKQIFVIHPWVSRSKSHIVIEPKVMEDCQDEAEQHKFKVVATAEIADGERETVWWQRNTGSANDGQIQKKKLTSSQMEKYLVREPSRVWKNIIGEWPAEKKVYRMDFTAGIEVDPEWRLERVVVFASDYEGSLMTDSISWIHNCAAKHSFVDIINSDNQYKMSLKSDNAYPCAISVGGEEKRGKLTEKKITKLLEQYDETQDPYVYDKCAEQEKRSQRSVFPRGTPIRYHNDWDVFTVGGLIPVSNYEVYEKPCGWSEIPEEMFNKTLDEYTKSRPYMPLDDYSMSAYERRADWTRMMEEERSLSDPTEWDIVSDERDVQEFNRKLQSKKFTSEREVHLNAVCNNQKGMRIYNIKKSVDTPLIVQADLPSVMPVSHEVPFYFHVQREAKDVEISRCVPIKFDFHANSYYQVVKAPQPFCACGQYSKVYAVIKPLRTGATSLDVSVSWYGSIQGCDFKDQDTVHFDKFDTKFPFEIEDHLPTSKQQKIDIQCEKEQRALTKQTGSQVYVSDDLIPVLLKKAQQSNLPIQKNALHVLSTFLPLVQAYNQTKDKLPEQIKQQLADQIARSYQELFQYKLSDGSYSLLMKSRRMPDYPVTVLAYTALSQARELGFQHDESDLTLTYQWIAQKLNADGCVEIPSELYQSNWPFQHRGENWQLSKEELTAFTVAMLYQTRNHKFITRKAIKCIPETSQSRDDELTNAMIASIWAMKDNTDKAQEFLDKIELHGLKRIRVTRAATKIDVFKPQYEALQRKPSVLAFYVLAVSSSKKIEKDNTYKTLVRELLLNSTSLEDPLALYAVGKAWPHLKKISSTPELKLNGKTIAIPAYGVQKADMEKSQNTVEVRKGCVVMYQVAAMQKRAQRDVETRVQVKNLENGYKNCGTRMIQICHDYVYRKYNEKTPAYLVRIPYGFKFDQETMAKMYDARQTGVDQWVFTPRGLMVIPTAEVACANIPLVQVLSIQSPKRGYVQIYDSNTVDFEPTYVEYEIPVECQVQSYSSAPVSYETVPCPQVEKETCPLFMANSRNTCKGDDEHVPAFPLKSVRGSSQWTEYGERRASCYKFTLQVYNAEDQTDEPRELIAYLRKDCGFTPPSTQGYILLKNSHATSDEHQLDSEDSLVFTASRACQKNRRNKRDVTQAAATTNVAAAATAASAAAAKRSSNEKERSGEYQQYEQEASYSPAPAAKGYPAPPAYPAQSYEAPAYQAPAYEPPAYNPPAKGYAPAPYSPPAYEAPAYEAPAKGYAPPPPPVYEPAPPSYAPPAYAPPAYAPPAYSPPAYEAPAYSPPAYSPPAYAPAYSPPAYEAPAYQAPAYEPPAYSPPAKGYAPAPYSPPAYEAPAYSPPAYSPPAYAPAYPAPAYPAPAYPAPAYPAPAYEAPAYQAPAYEAPAYQAPAYEAPAYQAPAYEPPAYSPPAKGYAPAPYSPPAYEAPAYSPPAYSPPAYAPAYPAPAYPAPAYQAPAYEAPAYSPPAYAPAYPAPAYQAPAYEAPAYQAPAYEPSYAPPAYAPPAYSPPAYEAPAYQAPAKGYAPPVYEPPTYSPPAYSPPAYEAPAYSPPAYSPPAYSPPAYSPPAYSPPAYEAPAYQAPAYEAPAKGYSPPAYAPPAYAPPAYEAPAYAPPAYSPPAYSPPAYEAPAYAPPAYSPPAYAPPAYAPPAYEAPAYAPPAYAPPAKGYAQTPYKKATAGRQNAGRVALGRLAGSRLNPASNPWARAQLKNKQYSRSFQGMALAPKGRRYSQSASEGHYFWAQPEQRQQECKVTKYEPTCPKCFSEITVDVMDKLCTAKDVFIADLSESYKNPESPVRCGNYTLSPLISEKTISVTSLPFTMKRDCPCGELNQGRVIVLSDIDYSDAKINAHKLARETVVVAASSENEQQIRQLYSNCASA